MILLVDNYDSFTYNLYQALAGLGVDTLVRRNDALDTPSAVRLAPSAVVISPGPGRPDDAGICLELLEMLPPSTPVLGICLGHQCLVEYHGGRLEIDPAPVHGKASLIHHEQKGIFYGAPNPFSAGRYHSLRAASDRLPDELELTAWSDDGLVMAVEHRRLPRYGLQFHPESILTPIGDRLLRQFLALSGISSNDSYRKAAV